MLSVEDLVIHYGEAVAVQGVSLEVDTGELVCLLGPNGAGKTSLLNAVCGLIKPTSGKVTFLSKEITGKAAAFVRRQGISQVPEGRKLFPSLSVLDNMKVGAYLRSDHAAVQQDLAKYEEMFPFLQQRRAQSGGSLSGGEQQIVAIVRALMSRPKLMLFDEPSLGLAPIFVKKIYEIISEIHRQDTAILLVEQNARMALEVASRVYVMDAGQMVVSCVREEIETSDEAIKKAYFGECEYYRNQ